jgi:hypothetical protein
MTFYYIEYVSRILTGFFVGILLNDFFERKFPNEYKFLIEKNINLLVNFSYKCVYYYSKLQILYFSIKDALNKYIDNNPALSNIRIEINKMLYNNNLHESELSSYFVKDSDIYESHNELNYFSILTDFRKKPVFKKILYDQIDMNHDNIDFVKSIAHFLLIEFTVDNNTFKIDLLTNEFDYYFLDNKFTKEFFIYYVKTHLKSDIKFTPESKCSLKIIDNDVNTSGFDFTSNQSIILTLNGYKINFTEKQCSEKITKKTSKFNIFN